MSYIGFRIEIASRILSHPDKIKEYNDQSKNKIVGIDDGGKISVKRGKEMLTVHGQGIKKAGVTVSDVNFAVLTPIKKSNVSRVVQIINILGNGKIIRERIKTFADGQSALNNLPELEPLLKVFKDLNEICPGLIKSGWYYAPEIKL